MHREIMKLHTERPQPRFELGTLQNSVPQGKCAKTCNITLSTDHDIIKRLRGIGHLCVQKILPISILDALIFGPQVLLQ